MQETSDLHFKLAFHFAVRARPNSRRHNTSRNNKQLSITLQAVLELVDVWQTKLGRQTPRPSDTSKQARPYCESMGELPVHI